MAKEIITSFMICFWLFFPFFVGSIGYSIPELDLYNTIEDIENSKNINQNSGLWTSLSSISSYIMLYLKLMFLVIPGVPLWIRLFVYVLQVLTGLVAVLIIRGI